MSAADSRAVSCAVPDTARTLAALDRFDYLDAFAVTVPVGDGRSAEAWARAMFSPRGFFGVLGANVWRSATGVVPPQSGKRLAAFQLVTPERNTAILVGDGPRYRIRLVVLAHESRLTLATFVQSRATIWRLLLKAIMIGHRRVAPLLLERAATNRRPQTTVGSAVDDEQLTE